MVLGGLLYWCGMGESNSRFQFGKLKLYHLTNPAVATKMTIAKKD